MEKVMIGSPVVLLMEVKSPDTPFFAKVGDLFKVEDIGVDPSMPSGYSVKLFTYGGGVYVDRSAVVHYDDWKNIYNAVIKNALAGASL